jgi:hypothetical protein
MKIRTIFDFQYLTFIPILFLMIKKVIHFNSFLFINFYLDLVYKQIKLQIQRIIFYSNCFSK